MRLKTLLIVAAGLSMAGQSGGVLAQDNSLSGSLNENSKRTGNPYETRTVTLEAGKRYALSVRSSDFDPMLTLFDEDGETEIASDDDGGENLDSLLEFMPESSGAYRLRVTSVNDEMGNFTIGVEELQLLPDPVRPTSTGEATYTFDIYRGELTRSDGKIKDRPVDDYLFHFTGGKPVMLFLDRAQGSDIDPVIEIRSPSDRYSQQAIERDDDGGDGYNSLLVFTPETTGPYLVRASSVNGEYGAYELRVGKRNGQ